jgi:hypothetical protein
MKDLIKAYLKDRYKVNDYVLEETDDKLVVRFFYGAVQRPTASAERLTLLFRESGLEVKLSRLTFFFDYARLTAEHILHEFTRLYQTGSFSWDTRPVKIKAGKKIVRFDDSHGMRNRKMQPYEKNSYPHQFDSLSATAKANAKRSRKKTRRRELKNTEEWRHIFTFVSKL